LRFGWAVCRHGDWNRWRCRCEVWIPTGFLWILSFDAYLAVPFKRKFTFQERKFQSNFYLKRTVFLFFG
jgi:hypothetical protein